MARLLALLGLGGLAAYVVILRRRLGAAQMRGDMYREIAVRLDQKVAELDARR
jgi:hypothetical protein